MPDQRSPAPVAKGGRIDPAIPSAKKSAAAQALGEAIRSARKERGYAQEAFATRVGLDRSYYGAIERGEFNVTLGGPYYYSRRRNFRSGLTPSLSRRPAERVLTVAASWWVPWPSN
jgi:transcriptional regulator with XRE-family HTH domain